MDGQINMTRFYVVQVDFANAPELHCWLRNNKYNFRIQYGKPGRVDMIGVFKAGFAAGRKDHSALWQRIMAVFKQ
jgi:hypothetical protein